MQIKDNNKTTKKGGLYEKINMTVKTADIIITVLILALVVTVAIALNM